MTEPEWRSCDDAGRLLKALHKDGVLGRPGALRRHLLFACACCRHIWDLIPYGRSRYAVRQTELYADGLIPTEQWWEAVQAAPTEAPFWDPSSAEAMATAAVAQLRKAHDLRRMATFVADYTALAEDAHAEANSTDGIFLEITVILALFQLARETTHGTQAVQARRQCADLVRDIFRYPAPPPVFNPSWRTRIVTELATAVYDRRKRRCVPVLVEALEGAGCDNDEILNHLRNPDARHTRGCWVLDLILGRE
jgi:hypothetical protein